MNFQGFPSTFDQNVLIKLLYKLNVSERPLIGDVHQCFAIVYIYDCHRNRITHWTKDQKHHPTANIIKVFKFYLPYFKLCEMFMLQDIQQIVCLEWPNPECLLFWVLGDYFSIEFVKFYEVRPFENEVSEQFLTALFGQIPFL